MTTKTYKLVIVNEMYRFAFETKKHQIAKKYPHLTRKELHKKVTSYFVSLPTEDEGPYYRPWLAQVGLLWDAEK